MGRGRKYYRSRPATAAERQRAHRRRKRTKVYHRTNGRDDWETPRDLFAGLNREFRFTLDAAASATNAKCKRFYTVEDDALTQPWNGRVFCNPPFGRDLARWVTKAIEESKLGATIVLLIPARTGTRWFHALQAAGAEIRFLPGRIRFVGAEHPAPFDVMVAVLR